MMPIQTSDPDWLVSLADSLACSLADASIGDAARHLSRHGFVVILASDGMETSGLPSATEAEVAASGHSRNPAAFRLRRRIARSLAAAASGMDVASLEIITAANGKPEFTSTASGLHVSFASRGGVNLVAMARRPIGVDIEAPVIPGAIPWNILRLDEVKAIRALPEEAQAPAFSQLWTAKEAVLKISGAGLMQAPETIRIGADGRVFDSSEPEGNSVWRQRSMALFHHAFHGVFHNTVFVAVALLSDSSADPSNGHHS